MYLSPSTIRTRAARIDGNTAAALGCVYAGATVGAWYPITPSTSLMDAFKSFCERYRKDPETGERRYCVVQAEDELAAIGIVLGATWNGARAFTPTSGPGLSLMSEFLGYAYYAELPAVLELEVIVRGNSIEVADRNTGLLQRLPNLGEGADYTGLSNYLRRVKIRFPEKKDATVLLEPDIPYDAMVQTMDTMKSFDTELDGQPVRGELFPQIAVGDAPVAVPPAQVAQR